MGKFIKCAILLLSFFLGILIPVSPQNINPTIENMYNKDFIFRVLGVQEAGTSDWETFNYIIPGHVDYRTNEKNELKVFFKEQTITYEFEPTSEIETEVNNSGQTMMFFSANAINISTGINCRLVIASVSGTDQFYFIITSKDGNPVTGYVIKYGF